MTSAPAGQNFTEEEYWRMFDSVRGDVEAAIKSNYAHLMVHGLASADRTIFDKYQRHAHFWSLHTYALQQTFFVAFGRIFDARKDCFSVQKLVKATIANPQFFSKSALRARRRKNDNMTGADPQWLVDFVNQAWEPARVDLEPMDAALAPHYAKLKSIYQPIRHRYVAHRGMDSQQAIQALFSKALKTDVAEILGFLHTLLWAIRDMAWNASVPELSSRADYDQYVKCLDKQIEDFVRKLP